jgi:exopolysaccharide production protein ExoQ
MSSSLAACLFVAFILWLFYRDSKNSPKVSKALWIPTVWIGILSSKPVAYWISGNPREFEFSLASEGNAIDRYVSLVLILAGLFVLTRRQIDWRKVWEENRWIWLFYAYAFISVWWSDYPFLAGKRWVRDVGNVVMILIVLTEDNPVEAIRQTFVRCAYVLIPLSILFIKYYLEIGRHYNAWTGEAYFCGVTTYKNSLGRLAMVSGLFLLWSVVDTQRCSGWFRWIKLNLPELLVLLMCAWILVVANSATSLFCSFLGTAVFFASRVTWMRTNPARWVCCAWCLVFLSLVFFFVPDLRGVFTNVVGRSSDLTERTEVYRGCLSLNTNPLIGEGFGSFWLTRGGVELGEALKVTEAHNGYLETYLNGGLIGVVLLLAVLFAAARNTVKQIATGSAAANLYAALLLSCLIYNFTEATFNNNHPIGIILWLIAMGYPPPVAAMIDTGDSESGSYTAEQNFCVQENTAGSGV